MDYRLEQLINGPAGTHPLWDAAMTAVASWAEPLFIALVVVWILYGIVRSSPEDRLGGVLALLGAGLALLVNLILSHLYYEPRPFVAHPTAVHVLLQHSKDASFPSDHAAAAFAIGVILARRNAALGALALAYGLVMDYARVYVGDHYPQDVFAGTIVGLAAALVCLLWVKGPLAAAQRRVELRLNRLVGRNRQESPPTS